MAKIILPPVKLVYVSPWWTDGTIYPGNHFLPLCDIHTTEEFPPVQDTPLAWVRFAFPSPPHPRFGWMNGIANLCYLNFPPKWIYECRCSHVVQLIYKKYSGIPWLAGKQVKFHFTVEDSILSSVWHHPRHHGGVEYWSPSVIRWELRGSRECGTVMASSSITFIIRQCQYFALRVVVGSIHVCVAYQEIWL